MFDTLFSPIDLGHTKVRNRIVSSANFTGLGENNLPTERLAEYHAAKARGGIGITILEELPVSSTSKFSHERSIYAYDKKCIPGFKVLTSRVHEYGAITLGQLMHVGLNTTGFDPWGLQTKLSYGPSPIPSIASPDGYSVARELDVSQIEKEVINYGLAATNLLEAGFDGVEIKADAGALPMQFLSPITNMRRDEFGGSLTNRMKFLDLVIKEIYEVTNGKKILGMKLVSNEFTEYGLSKADVKEITMHLDSLGRVDYVAAASGNPGIDPDYNTPSAYYPQAVFVDLAENIKRSVSARLKVMALGRITDPAVANRILEANKADFVIMMRAIIADPDLPKKAREGRLSEIIPCIGCNNCLHRVLSGRPTGCLLNPVTAREEQWGPGTLMPTKARKSILIIGAGPAGIECARISAMRGHRVVLYERDSLIGGQTRLAGKIPPLNELAKAIRFWEAEIQRLGISLKLNRKATLSDIEQEMPNVVVFATGAKYSRKGYSPAFPQPPSGHEMLREISELATAEKSSSLDNQIVIYDDRGDIQGLGWAELALDKGCKVTYLTRNPMPAMYAPDWSLHTALKRLLPRKLQVETNMYLKKIGNSSVTIVDLYTQMEKTIAADRTYFLSWPTPEDELWKSLGDSNRFDVYAIGDCVSPRSIEEAIMEGHSLGRKI